MGCFHSKQMCSTDKTYLILKDNFKKFIEENCIFGSDKSVHIQKMHSAFLFYLNQNNVKVDTFWYSAIDIVKIALPKLLKECCETIILSPGYTPYSNGEGISINVDTRYVIGMDVVRFQK